MRKSTRTAVVSTLLGLSTAGAWAEGGPRRQPGSSPEALLRAVEQRDRMSPADFARSLPAAAGVAAAPVPQARWEFIGPRNVLDERYISPDRCTDSTNRPIDCLVSGRVNAAAYYAANPAVRYLAAAHGGVWKSTDSGRSWYPKTDHLPFLQTSSVAIDPRPGRGVVYVGTGDFDGSWHAYSMGIVRSTDGGNAWTQATMPSPYYPATGNAISAIVIDPESPDVVTAVAGRGVNGIGHIWQSIDAGESWRVRPSGFRNWSDLEIGRASAGGVRYYWAVAHGGHVWRSADRGRSWQPVSAPPGSSGNVALEVAASRRSSQTVYVAVGGYAGPPVRVYVSRDAGASWSELGSFDYETQGGWDLVLACGGNSREDVVYVGANGHFHAYRSSTRRWTWLPSGHVDQHDLAVHPNPSSNEFMIANDGGIFRRTFNTTYAGCGSNGDAACWRGPFSQNATLHTFKIQGLSTHPSDSARLAGGTQDNGTVVARGNLASWRESLNGDGMGTAFAPTAPEFVYGANKGFEPGFKIHRSRDGGDTFLGMDQITPPWQPDDVFTFATGIMYLDPNGFSDGSEGWVPVYAPSNFLWRRDLTTWARVGSEPIASIQATTLSIPLGDPDIVYTGAWDGRVTMVESATLWAPTFTNLSADLPGAGWSAPVRVVSVDPTDSRDILVGRGGLNGAGSLYRCVDTEGGCSPDDWRNVGEGLPPAGVNDLARDPDNPATTWYAATDVGVFATTDAGGTWSNATAPLGLPNVVVAAINANPVTRYLTAGTYGRGVWRIALGGAEAP